MNKNKSLQKIISLVMSLAMIIGMSPITAMAADSPPLGASGTITAFAELADDVKNRTVAVGTLLAVEDLALPDTLTATVAEPDTASPAVTEQNGTETDITGVTWLSTPEYTAITVGALEFVPQGTYEFMPVLPDGYTLANGVSLPVITVVVEPMGIVPTAQVAATLDFTSGGDASGDGYAWDSGTSTLTLSGLDLSISGHFQYAMMLPADTTIVLTEGTTNKIELITATILNPVAIQCSGGLTIMGGGALEVISTTSVMPGPPAMMPPASVGISTSGVGNITIEGGTVMVTATTPTGFASGAFGIQSAGTFSITGGTVTVTSSGRAISKDYTVPDGYKYWTNTTAAAGGTETLSTGDTTTDKIGSSHKYAKVKALTPAEALADTLNCIASGTATVDGTDPTKVNVTGAINIPADHATITVPDGVTLDIADTGSLTVQNSGTANGIEVSSGGSLTVSGGSLMVQNSSTDSVHGINVAVGGNMTVSGGTVTVANTGTGGAAGICVKGNMTVSGGMVNVNNSGDSFNGISVESGGTMTISSGGTVNVANTVSSGISVNSGTLKLEAGASDAVLNLNGNAYSLLIGGGGTVTGTTGTGKAKIVIGATAQTAATIFYPADSTTKGAAAADTTYVWDANAGGTGVAGWKEVVPVTLHFGNGTGGWKLYTDDNLTTEYTEQTDKWSASANTLNLNGFSFETDAEDALLLSETTTIINITGTNTIESTFSGTGNSRGIFSDGGSLTIQGTGELHAIAGVPTGTSFGLATFGDFTMTGGTLYISGGKAIAVVGSYSVPANATIKGWDGRDYTVAAQFVPNGGFNTLATNDSPPTLITNAKISVPTGGGGTGGGSSSSSSSSSSKRETSPAPVITPMDDKSSGTLNTAINSAANAATSSGKDFGVILKNVSNFTKENAAAILQKAKSFGKKATVSSDIMSEDGKYVEVRVTLDPEMINKTVRLDGYIRQSQILLTESKFKKHFDNKTAVVSLGQEGVFGQTAKIAAKVNLSGFDSKNLYFYSYDKKANTYTRIEKSAYRIDANGYLHFETDNGGDIIISSGPLARK